MEITTEDVEMLVVPKPPSRSRRDDGTQELRPDELEEMMIVEEEDATIQLHGDDADSVRHEASEIVEDDEQFSEAESESPTSEADVTEESEVVEDTAEEAPTPDESEDEREPAE